MFTRDFTTMLRLMNADDKGVGGDTSGPEASGQPANLMTVPKSEYDKLKSQYDGLRGYVDGTLKPENQQLQARITQLTSEYEAQITTLTGERDAATSNLEGVRGELQEATGRLGKLERNQEIGRTIGTKFPALAELHAQGLVNTEGLEGEALESYLEGLNTRFGQVADAAVDRALDGATPDVSAGVTNAGMTSGEVYDRMMAINPDSPEHAELQALYLKKLSEEG